MSEIAAALPWLAFWGVIALCVWVSHVQFMAGYDTWLFEHKTKAEQRLRAAAIRRANQHPQEPKCPKN